MAEATLNDVSAKLSASTVLEEITAKGVQGLRDDFQRLYGLQEKLLRSLAEKAREGGTKGKGDGATPATQDPAKGMNPFFAAAIVAAVAVFTAVKDYFKRLGKTLRFLFRSISKVFKGFLKISKIGEYAADVAKQIKGSIKAVFKVMGRALRTLVPDLDPLKNGFKRITSFFKNTGKTISTGVDNALKSFRSFIKSVRSFFSSGGTKFMKFLTDNSIFKVLSKGFNAIKNFLFGSFDGGDVKSIKGFASGIMQRVSDFFKPVRTFFSADGPIGKIGKVISKAFGFLKAGSGFMKILVGIGRVIGKIAWPITVLFALIDGIGGFFEAFGVTEGSGIKKFVVGLLGAFAGVVSGIFGVIPDLLKEVVSFIAGLFGFDQVKEVLDSFSFTDMIKNIIMSPIVMLKRALNAILEGVATTIENLEVTAFGKSVGIPGRDKLAESLRSMKFDTEDDEAYTEKVARKKQEDIDAGKALDAADAEKGYGKAKYNNPTIAKKMAKRDETVVQDNEGNYRIVKKKKGSGEITPAMKGVGRTAEFLGEEKAAPTAMPGGAPIIVQDNSQQVSGGGTVLAGETRPSTGNGQALKTGFYPGVTS